MKNRIDFSDRELFLVTYYRSPWLSSWRRRAWLEGGWIVISLGAAGLCFMKNDPGYGVIAYTLLLWRACASIWKARGYAKDHRSMICKYDARVAELSAEAAQNPEQRDPG